MTSGKQVLLVEDDEQSMRILERWFADEGFEVVPCARFEAARLFLASHTPDVLVTDVRLGAFNGLQLVLMAKDAHPRTIAIVISGFEDPVLKQEAERVGARYLIKPLRREEVIESTHA
jgi:DNA-binding NtrC family response regulator